MSHHGSHAARVLEEFKTLGLTGKILSVTATIPCAVAINQHNEIEVSSLPRKTSLDALLSSIREAGWTQTIIGLTGEVLPVQHETFQKLVRFNQEEEFVAADDYRPMAYLGDNPPNYFKEFSAFRKESQTIPEFIGITATHRDDLSRILKAKYTEEIIPVWVGKYTKETLGTVFLNEKDKSRYSATTSAMLFQTLYQTGWTVGDQLRNSGHWKFYVQLNYCVAEAVIKAYTPGDIIWILTHQHMLLVEILREKLPAAIIIYGQHEPWPANEVMTKFFNHEFLMRSLLHADGIVVPDQYVFDDLSKYYTDHHEVVTEIVASKPRDRGSEQICAPLGLDTSALREDLERDEVIYHLGMLRNTHAHEKIIVARARIDQLKGMLVVLGAFQHLLRTQAAWKDRVVLVLIVTNDRLPEYQFLGGLYSETEFIMNVADTNTRYGSASWVPVIYLGSYRPRAEYLALLKVADVGIAVNNREHDNDMSREFVLSQQDSYSPLLVAVWSIDKTQAGDVVDQTGEERLVYGKLVNNRESRDDVYLHDALRMSDLEKQARHRELLDKFTSYSTASVTDGIVRKIARTLNEKGVVQGPSALVTAEVQNAYKSSQKRLFIFDYDGTLTPIVNNPDNAIPTKDLLRVLEKLAKNDKNIVYIVSGRSRKFLQDHFGSIKKLGLSAEHGCYLKKHDSDAKHWLIMTKDLDLGWKSGVEAAFGRLETRWPMTWIEKKEVAMVWHYRGASDHEACLKAAKQMKETIEATLGTEFDLEVMLGKANLEARPRSLNKGSTVARLMEMLGVDGEGKFVFCAGDDTTDEDMFRGVLSWSYSPKHVFTCLVDQETRPTLAQFCVREPRRLTQILGTLVLLPEV